MLSIGSKVNINTMLGMAYEKLLKYFNISSELAIVATVLDARFKMEYYSMNPENKEVLTQQVQKLYDGSDEVFLSLIV